MKTLREVLKENPNREIISRVLGLHKLEFNLHLDRRITDREYEKICSYASREEPMGYLFPEMDFGSLTLTITKDVLIPRQETEILLEKIIHSISDVGELWDVCTGSGCLGLGIKKALPKLDVTLSDISEKSIEVARKNAKQNNVVVNFLVGDLLEPFVGRKADVVVCNPPYISEEEFHTLDPSVKNFEPKRALVSGKTGLEFYERLAKELPAHLNSGAKVFFEIGTGQGEKIQKLFCESHWKKVRYEPDWAGHDRFFFLEYHPIS